MFKLLNRTFRVQKLNKKSLFCEFTVPANKYHQCLEEIGEIEAERDGNRKYSSGQCFLHKLFAYRGIILCSWKGHMYSKNDKEKTKIKPTVQVYYQVLRDNRDVPYTNIQTDCEKMHKFSKWNLMFSTQGLDNVLHDDILPYRSTNSSPLKHPIFSKLFAVTNNYLSVSRSMKILPKLYLYEWKRKYQPWLNSTQVHKITKDNIKITAMPFYAGKRKLAYWWLLGIRVENLSNDSIIIQGKDWRIYNNVTRELEKIKFKGPSLLCHEAILPPESAAIQYYDYINLFQPEGVIGCYYRIINLSNLSSFLCPILLFSLNSTITDHSRGENFIDWY